MKKTALLLLLALTACKGATAAAPKVGADELRAEQTEQQKLAKEAAIKRGEEVVKITTTHKNRLATIGSKVSKAGEQMCKEMGRSQCSFGVKIEESADLNAYADGSYIVVSSAMIDFTTDTELANVLSHEYAHNIMQHVATQSQNVAVGGILGTIADQLATSQGINTGGVIGKLGANYSLMKYSVGFEQEADYVGLYVMERAGYDINQSPNFWRKMSQADSRGITMKSTHPTNPERYVALNKTIEEIKAKKAAKQPLLPAFKG